MAKTDGKSTRSKQPKKQPGKPVTTAEATPEIYNPDPCAPGKPALRAKRTESFLLVEVCKGAPRGELIKAIDQALMTAELPFFKEHSRTRPVDPRAVSSTDGAAEPLALSKKQVADGDALLILVQQEGY